MRPKVLLPVANRPLLDWAVDRLLGVTPHIAVNAHTSQGPLIDHVRSAGWHLGVEVGEALGTAGPLAAMRDWIDGRSVVVVNGDTWAPAAMAPLLDGWDGDRIRVMVVGDRPLGPRSRIVGSLMPWAEIERLQPVPTGLWEGSWRAAVAAGRVESIAYHGPFVDCATAVDYLQANHLAAPGGMVAAGAMVTGRVTGSVVGEAAAVHGDAVDSVVWPGAVVGRRERLWRSIRTDGPLTVAVRA